MDDEKPIIGLLKAVGYASGVLLIIGLLIKIWPYILGLAAIIVAVKIIAALGSDSRPCSPGMGDGHNPPRQPWEEAGDHVGEWVTVEGPVVSTYFAEKTRGRPTFLNVGRPHPEPGRVTILIWGSDRDQFPRPPEEWFAMKGVRVTGELRRHEGTLALKVRK